MPLRGGTPAPAGIGPLDGAVLPGWAGYPRASGDRPTIKKNRDQFPRVPPRQRGSAARLVSNRVVVDGTPAPAGIGRGADLRCLCLHRYPRASGDRPSSSTVE